MIYHEQSEDYRPLFWIQGRPVFATTFLIGLHTFAFVSCALCMGFAGGDFISYHLALITQYVWQGEVWRLFTYVALGSSMFSGGALWFLINLLMFYFFGREVEQFVGRKNFLIFYVALILIPAMLLCLVGLFHPAVYLNYNDVFFGVFVAFATIYPGVMPLMWLPLSVRMLMWILLGVSTLIDFSSQNYTAIFMLWTCSVVGSLSMRLIGGGHGSHWLTDWLDERRGRKLAAQRNFKIVQEKKTTESIDAILEKISKKGVGSLDAQERAALERARTKLLQRDER
jgi:membrane associated rhomboid family serine protease